MYLHLFIDQNHVLHDLPQKATVTPYCLQNKPQLCSGFRTLDLLALFFFSVSFPITSLFVQ